MHGPTAAAIRSTLGAERDHRRDRLVGDPGQRAAPAGMGGADHARFGIGEQHRRAVGGDDAEQQARPVGDQRVGVRALVVGPRRSVTMTAVGEWIWWTLASGAPGRIASAARRRLFCDRIADRRRCQARS